MKNKPWIPHEEALKSMEIVFDETESFLADYNRNTFHSDRKLQKEHFSMKRVNSLEVLKFRILGEIKWDYFVAVRLVIIAFLSLKGKQ